MSGATFAWWLLIVVIISWIIWVLADHYSR
jgi:hypothetical protein